jgi:hypothetical protein
MKSKKKIFRWVKIPFPKIVKNLPGPMRSFIVKENHIGSAVSQILYYRQKKIGR